MFGFAFLAGEQGEQETEGEELEETQDGEGFAEAHEEVEQGKGRS